MTTTPPRRMDRPPYPTPSPRATEAQCEDAIIGAARLLGYRVHAERPARQARGWATAIKGDAGWPDLVLVGHGHLIVVELKRKPNRVEPAQQAWHDALARAGVDCRVVWVPEGMDAFLADLARGFCA